MITKLNKTLLFSTFNVENFSSLEDAINGMAPSMVEYYLSDMSTSCDDLYLNKKEVENFITVGEYTLYTDYNEDIYLEIEVSYDEFETGSLW
ncbi:MAG: hypothetical protein ACNI3C_10615 [Candidatus Marinarcus sp.]|uniref:hypothetical protein n=1 Tax=Candidatus Marinarcus sp. TaxID=3100987 RepID=UPI003AFF853F